jgi:uncharacterized protein YkwD
MKRNIWIIVSLFAAIAIIFSGCSNSTSSDLVPDVTENEKIEIEDLVSLVNEHRKELGFSELQWSNELALIAQEHSQDMSENDYLSHINKAGEDPSDRVFAKTDKFTFVGENIALGYKSGSSVFSGWLASKVHKDIMENNEFTHHGVGYVEDGNYWTHVFAKIK